MAEAQDLEKQQDPEAGVQFANLKTKDVSESNYDSSVAESSETNAPNVEVKEEELFTTAIDDDPSDGNNVFFCTYL